jgi:hypothetical protein
MPGLPSTSASIAISIARACAARIAAATGAALAPCNRAIRHTDFVADSPTIRLPFGCGNLAPIEVVWQ